MKHAALATILLACGGRGPDVIYLPSAGDVVTRMLEVARVDSGDVVFDLGCGDGRIVIAAARDRGARGVCVDIDQSLVAQSRRNADTAGVADRIEFRHADMFETDLYSATVGALNLSRREPGRSSSPVTRASAASGWASTSSTSSSAERHRKKGAR